MTLIAHWKLNEGEGTTAQDSAGSHDGTIVSAEWMPQAPSSLYFSSGGEVSSIQNGADLRLSSDLTVTAWIAAMSSGDTQGWIASCGGSRTTSSGLWDDGRAVGSVCPGRWDLEALWMSSRPRTRSLMVGTGSSWQRREKTKATASAT